HSLPSMADYTCNVFFCKRIFFLGKSGKGAGTIAEKISLSYTPSCWSVEFVADITPENEQYMILFKLANIGTPFGIDLMGSSD
ncbi:MAG: hypothetical protein D3907_06190, partial [Candidatus Electrothrix sp. AUS3]|nr:hypothetical protein [Candidatus Electrothrix gigas]